MREFFQVIVVLGVANWAVSIIEFIVYRKTSSVLILAIFLFIIGFGGLFVYDKIKGRK